MAFTLSDEYIAILRKNALSAEPYPAGDPMLECLDDDPHSPVWKRQIATHARQELRKYGLPLVEGIEDPPDPPRPFSTLSDEEIRELRRRAFASEPYPDNDPIYGMKSKAFSEYVDYKRLKATSAVRELRRYGIPLEENK